MRRKKLRKTAVVTLLAVSLAFCTTRASAEEKVLFDFEDAAQAAAWAMWQEPKPEKGRAPQAEPEATLTVEAGQLAVTYAGGDFPTIVTTQVPEDLTPFEAIKADVTVARAMVLGVRIRQEQDKTRLEDGWFCTMFLKPGKNVVSFSLKKPQRFRTRQYSAKEGKTVSLAFLVCGPNEGEKVLLDNVRVSTEDDPNADNKLTPNGRPENGYRVLGTELVVKDVADLGNKLKDKWVKPEKDVTLEEREAEFKSLYNDVKVRHPKAVMVVFRQGQKGYDPADPEKAYEGWANIHVNSHGPDGIVRSRASNGVDRYGSLELFMRHRSQLIRIDLSSIPKGSKVLAARLLLVTGMNRPVDKPNMFAAEACNRPWVEGEANCYQYAKGKLWKWPSGQAYDGDDPDYLPLFLAYGPAQGQTNVWDFTEAAKGWIEQGKSNHGFFLHGDAQFYARTFTKQCKEAEKRPAFMVIYEP